MFNMRQQVVVFFIFCVGAGLGEKAKLCEKSQSFSDVRIPFDETFSQGDFDYYVSGPNLKGAYVLLPNPTPFPVNTNYDCTINKIDNSTYQQVCHGFDSSCTTCLEYSFPITSEIDGNKVIFTSLESNGNKVNNYYWSFCPTKYLLRLQCPRHSLQQHDKCARTGARITVYLVGDVSRNNVPLTDISLDIFAKTGVKFGEIDGMNWFTTENTGTQCDVCQRR
ncbi:uncharacterized protein LOC132754737 [Ruditapes philippinarum]|uniref:uncharacterized protein LOC132754737 n=1 Tax=Ruditapes philippinarum TaxID=129788 RepID=UPI00295AAF7C|nr:uncharacterized protein LOC132754737 [Ruditapes philippinarum]